jgi:hypothetical protein
MPCGSPGTDDPPIFVVLFAVDLAACQPSAVNLTFQHVHEVGDGKVGACPGVKR